MPTIEEINLGLDNEITNRKTSDNNLKMLMSNEEANRIEGDAKNSLKLSEEITDRAKLDSNFSVKLYEEITKRTKENSELKMKILNLEEKVNAINTNTATDNKSTTDSNKEESTAPKLLMISQEMFERQLNMLKRSAKFTLANANVKKIAETKESSVEFLRHLNNLQLTFDNLLANKNKYTLTDATKKCITEAESLKKQLNKFANDNWDVDSLFVSRSRGDDGGC